MLVNKKMTGNNQHGFIKGKSCLTSLMAFYDRATELVDGGKAIDIVYLGSCKVLNTDLHDLLVSNQERHVFDRSTTQCIKT